MKDPISQYCLRMPRPAYDDALDVALVFGLSMNQFLVGAVRHYVQTQLEQESIHTAVSKVREARKAGLAHGLVAQLAGGTDTRIGSGTRRKRGVSASPEPDEASKRA